MKRIRCYLRRLTMIMLVGGSALLACSGCGKAAESTDAETVTEMVMEQETANEQNRSESLAFSETETASDSNARFLSDEETTAAEETAFTRLVSEISDFPVAKPNLVEIDYVDYESGMISVHFLSRVDWREPVVRVTDAHNYAYPAEVGDTSMEGCTILVEGLKESGEYEFMLGGLVERESEELTTLKGYFKKPEVAPGA